MNMHSIAINLCMNMSTKAIKKVVKPSEIYLKKIEKLTKTDDKFLDIHANLLKSDNSEYNDFFASFEHWYHKNSRRYMRYLSVYGRDFITKVEFKLALKDLRVPFNNTQLHIIYKWLDPEKTGLVEYSTLYEAFCRALAKHYTDEDEVNTMDLEDTEKWIVMTFKAPTYDPLDMPTSFEQLIHLGYTGNMLRQLIHLKVPQLPSHTLVLFTDPAHYNETIIHCNQKLYDFDFIGGSKITPTEGTIYYEYSVGYVDAPLLLCNREVNEINLMSYMDNQQLQTSQQDIEQQSIDNQNVDRKGRGEQSRERFESYVTN
ncbi:unnamed protein product [Trichobilharzia regenti]|nr:unnamed protein product [Trichobilharzia regenti]